MAKLINVIKGKFEIIPKEVFLDRRLDYRSRGLLCTIFSLPDGWEFSTLGLAELVTVRDENGNEMAGRGEGKAAVRVALQHLEELGYLERIQAKGEKGFYAGYDYKLNIPPIVPEA